MSGMDCASCAVEIEKALKSLEGVEDVRVNVVTGNVRVEHAANGVTRADLGSAIRRIGFSVGDGNLSAAPSAISQDESDKALSIASFFKKKGRPVMTAVALAFLVLAFGAEFLAASAKVTTALFAAAIVAGGWYVVPRGLRSIARGSLEMNALMSIAAAGAWIIGDHAEAAVTLFLFAVAELLESYSMDRARNAIRSLMNLSPAQARVRRAGAEEMVEVADVSVGETVFVRPGEKIPVDGVVIRGRSSVNQAPITGESVPVDKSLDSEIFAGTMNIDGILEIRSSRLAQDTTLARIIHAVEEAQNSRAPSQTFVDRFARVYTPTVVVLAVFIAVGAPLLGLGSWDTWIYRALAMLVVACPCALVISTPVTIVSGLTGAARNGVLIKGGIHLESVGAVSVVAFDKTGTLTAGTPAVSEVFALDGMGKKEVIKLALGVERNSEHPLAQAIVAYGTEMGVTPPEADDFASLAGRGAIATVEGKVVYVGKPEASAETGSFSSEADEVVKRLTDEGKTAVVVSVAGKVIGVIGLADEPRPDALEAVKALHAVGISRIIMLSGDNEGTARAIASRIGVDEYRAGLLPEDKVRIVRELESSGERVAFVGDGVNDAPALAAATVGIAMGAMGTDVALETADIALMSDDLRKIAYVVRLSRRTMWILKQNIWFSIGVKAVFLVLAATGFATLWMAIAADMGASLAVVTNGLRARRLPA